MGKLSGRGTVLFLGSLFAFLFGALLYLQDTEPSGVIRSIEGKIVSRTPITTKGKLTGFRLCIGNEPMTFTYSDTDPNVERAWVAVNGAPRAIVRYTERQGRNPALWGLEVNGEVLATAAELQEARQARYYLYAAGFLLSVGVFAMAFVSGIRSRKSKPSGGAT